MGRRRPHGRGTGVNRPHPSAPRAHDGAAPGRPVVTPWPTPALVVPLEEAVLPSTSVMIGHARQAAFAVGEADHDVEAGTLGLRRDTELTREVHRLTVEVHRRAVDDPTGGTRWR